MADDLGLRERKKIKTRRALLEAGLRLFEKQGYEETTVAQIAAAAEVSTRTFFSYFAGKEELVFSNARERLDRALKVIIDRRPDESPVDVLVRMMEESVDALADDLAIEVGFAPTRFHLVMSSPALQARALHLVFEQQREMAAELHRAFPDRLDEATAAAAVGAVVGAAKAATLASVERGDGPDEVRAAITRATEIVVSGVRTL